MRLCESDT